MNVQSDVDEPQADLAGPTGRGAFVITVSVMAGIVEEAAFRGYMQSPLERRYGPAAAIFDYAGAPVGAIRLPQPFDARDHHVTVKVSKSSENGA
jgi:hypothetical protein